MHENLKWRFEDGSRVCEIYSKMLTEEQKNLRVEIAQDNLEIVSNDENLLLHYRND